MSNDSKESASKAEELATEAMAEVSRDQILERERAAKEAAGKSSKVQYAVLSVILLLLGVLIGLSLSKRMPFQVVAPAVSEVQLEENLRLTLNFAVRAIDAYRAANGRFPETLVEVGGPDNGGWTFILVDEDRYRVGLSAGPVSIEYDSNQNADTFFADVRQR